VKIEEYKINLNEEEIIFKCERNTDYNIKVMEIIWNHVDFRIEYEENNEESIYVHNIIKSIKVREVVAELCGELFRDYRFRNGIRQEISMYEYAMNEEIDRYEGQMYYLIFDELLKLVEVDLYYNFDYKEIHMNLAYKKFKLCERLYEENTNEYLFKNMYYESYTSFLNFAVERKIEVGPDLEDKIKDVFIKEENNIIKIKEHFYNNQKKVEYYIDNWFLRKSDYESVSHIMELISNDGEKINKKSINRNIRNLLLDNNFVCLIILLLPIIMFVFNRTFNTEYIRVAQQNIHCVIIVYLVLLSIYNRCKYKKFGKLYIFTRKYYPRVLGGIITGYALLLLGEEVYKYVINLDYIRIICIMAISLTLTFTYIYSSVLNRVKKSEYARKRAIDIILKGLCQSYILIYILNELVITGFLKGMIGENQTTKIYDSYLLMINPIIKGSLHHVKITLIYPVLALMIGMFLQLLWEEVEITKPL
jgi:hypothetical protein